MFRNKGKKFDIQEGEVTSVKKDKVKVCENGKLVQKEKSEVPTPYKIGCGGEKCYNLDRLTSSLFACVSGCVWYGRVICDGNVVKVGRRGSSIKKLYLLSAGPAPVVVPVQVFRGENVGLWEVLARGGQ